MTGNVGGLQTAKAEFAVNLQAALQSGEYFYST